MKKSKFLFIIGFSLIAATVSMYLVFKNSSNSFSSSSVNDKKIQVTASFYPLFFFSSQIGGDKAQVKNITPAGSEPHDYEPTTGDIARIESSNMLVLNGGVEAWGDKIKDNLKGTPVVIVVASEGLLTQQLTQESKNLQNPHIWLAPQLAKKEVKAIVQGFVKVDPQNKDYYDSNANMLLTKLDQLDTLYTQGLASCKQKDIITSHAAFGYLAKAYGLNQIAISGLSPDMEPSSQQLVEVAKFAKNHHVGYIFFESLVSPRLAETIANEVGAKTLVLDPLEGLSENDIKLGKNYFTVMENNLNNLQTAFQCTK